MHVIIQDLDIQNHQDGLLNDEFTVTILELTGENHYYHDNYQLATAVRGSGTVDGVPIKVGDNFLIPQGNKIVFDGHMTIMMTTR